MRIKILSLLALFLFSFSNIIQAEEQKESEVLTSFEQLMQQHRGKVIYLDFWASWCTPCRKSFPWMNEMQEKYDTQGFTVISVNLDAEHSLAEKFLQEIPASFVIFYDEKGVLAKKYKLKGMPSSYLFNRQGEMISSHSGFNDKKKRLFEQEIIQALK